MHKPAFDCGYFGTLIGVFKSLYYSELPLPIPQNSVESDHGCTSRVYFDNAGDNVTLTLYNVTLTLYNVTLTSQKPCFHNKKCDCSKTNGLNEVYVFFQ